MVFVKLKKKKGNVQISASNYYDVGLLIKIKIIRVKCGDKIEYLIEMM